MTLEECIIQIQIWWNKKEKLYNYYCISVAIAITDTIDLSLEK